VKNSAGIYGAVYRWGGSRTNATLLDAGGLDESFVVDDGGGVLRTQVWHYPSQTECQTCHTPQGGFGLGFRTEQLNRNFDYGTGPTNELAALSAAGYFNTPVTNVNALAALAAATNSAASVEFRARSFLAVNCSQCHQPGGSAQAAEWDARITTPTALAGLIYGQLVNNFGDPNNNVVTPAVPTNSVLLSRIAVRGLGSIQMPPLDSTVVDTQAVALVTQ
jgi:mono/diheme cytochrome c family protein